MFWVTDLLGFVSDLVTFFLRNGNLWPQEELWEATEHCCSIVALLHIWLNMISEFSWTASEIFFTLRWFIFSELCQSHRTKSVRPDGASSRSRFEFTSTTSPRSRSPCTMALSCSTPTRRSPAKRWSRFFFKALVLKWDSFAQSPSKGHNLSTLIIFARQWKSKNSDNSGPISPKFGLMV